MAKKVKQNMQSFNYARNHLCHRETGARKQKLPEEIRNKREKPEKITGSLGKDCRLITTSEMLKNSLWFSVALHLFFCSFLSFSLTLLGKTHLQGQIKIIFLPVLLTLQPVRKLTKLKAPSVSHFKIQSALCLKKKMNYMNSTPGLLCCILQHSPMLWEKRDS